MSKETPEQRIKRKREEAVAEKVAAAMLPELDLLDPVEWRQGLTHGDLEAHTRLALKHQFGDLLSMEQACDFRYMRKLCRDDPDTARLYLVYWFQPTAYYRKHVARYRRNVEKPDELNLKKNARGYIGKTYHTKHDGTVGFRKGHRVKQHFSLRSESSKFRKMMAAIPGSERRRCFQVMVLATAFGDRQVQALETAIIQQRRMVQHGFNAVAQVGAGNKAFYQRLHSNPHSEEARRHLKNMGEASRNSHVSKDPEKKAAWVKKLRVSVRKAFADFDPDKKARWMERSRLGQLAARNDPERYAQMLKRMSIAARKMHEAIRNEPERYALRSERMRAGHIRLKNDPERYALRSERMSVATRKRMAADAPMRLAKRPSWHQRAFKYHDAHPDCPYLAIAGAVGKAVSLTRLPIIQSGRRSMSVMERQKLKRMCRVILRQPEMKEAEVAKQMELSTSELPLLIQLIPYPDNSQWRFGWQQFKDHVVKHRGIPALGIKL